MSFLSANNNPITSCSVLPANKSQVERAEVQGSHIIEAGTRTEIVPFQSGFTCAAMYLKNHILNDCLGIYITIFIHPCRNPVSIHV